MESENGRKLIQFAQMDDLLVPSRKCQHKRIYKGYYLEQWKQIR